MMFLAKITRPAAQAVALSLIGATALLAQPGTSTPTGVLRMPPLPELTKTVNAVGYAMNVNQELQFLMLFTAGHIGYPMFPGASRTENTGLAVFQPSTTGKMPYVILCQFASNSKVPAKIEGLGWASKEVGGWRAFAPNPEFLSYVSEDNIDDILDMVRKRREFDIEFEVTRTREEMATMRENLAANTLRDYYETHGPEAEDAGADARLRNVDLAFSFLQNIRTSSIGVSLDSKNFVIGTQQEAWPDTPEGKFFSAPAGGPVAVAQLLPATGNAGLAYRVDPKTATAYLDSFLQRMQLGTDDESDALLGKIQSTLDTINEEWDGTGAYAMRFEQDNVDYTGVVGGDWTEEPFSSMLNELFSNLMPAILDKLPIAQYAAIMDVATDGMNAPSMLPSTELPVAMSDAVAGGSLSELENYAPPGHAIIDGKIVLSSQQGQLITQAANVKAGKPVANSIADNITLGKGDALHAYIDMKVLSLQSIDQLKFSQSPSLSLSLKQFAATKLEPMTIVVHTEDNTLTGRLTFPVATIRALSATIKEIDARQSESRQR